ncbi:MAG: 16S rRNA (guanine(527)-N(7))-methyltransferase RsmG [Bacillota bacterium]
METDAVLLLKKGAEELGVNLDGAKISALFKFKEILLEWNKKFNLTAITDEKEFIIKHFIDSLSVIPYLRHVKSLIDVGTGAGFPGIPLKIVMPSLDIILLESQEKKVKFLETVAGELGLTGIAAIHMRAEDAGRMPEYREKTDAAVARAVAPMPVLLEYCLPLVKQGGIFIAMKGGKEEELPFDKALEILGGRVEEENKFILPCSSFKRNVVVIRKFRQTPTNYPRKPGKPSKQPLV